MQKLVSIKTAVFLLYRPTTTKEPKCSRDTGYTAVLAKFVKYDNANNLLADGSRCDGLAGLCNVILDVCISSLGSR